MAIIDSTQPFDIIYELGFVDGVDSTFSINRFQKGSRRSFKSGEFHYRTGTSGEWVTKSTGDTDNLPTAAVVQIAHNWDKDSDSNVITPVFSDNANIKSIKITQKAPLSGEVGDYFMDCFIKNCPNLVEVDVPDISEVVELGERAFYQYAHDCVSLTSIGTVEPKNLSKLCSPSSSNILQEFVAGCTQLESITLPSFPLLDLDEEPPRFAYSMFEGCDSLNKVILPTSNNVYSTFNLVLGTEHLGQIAAYTKDLTYWSDSANTDFLTANDFTLNEIITTVKYNIYNGQEWVDLLDKDYNKLDNLPDLSQFVPFSGIPVDDDTLVYEDGVLKVSDEFLTIAQDSGESETAVMSQKAVTSITDDISNQISTLDFSPYVQKTDNLSDLDDKAEARNNLELGELATKNLSDLSYATTEHTHSLASSRIVGVLPISKGGTGGTTAEGARLGLGLGDLATKDEAELDLVKKSAIPTELGADSEARERYSTALGRKSKAFNNYSTALGAEAEATQEKALATGFDSQSTGKQSTALGESTKSSGFAATSVGSRATAAEHASTALGYKSTVYGTSSSAVGYNTYVSQDYSTAVGCFAETTANKQIQLGKAYGENTPDTIYAATQISVRSDERDKADIRNTILGLEFINKLRPVQWRWDLRGDYLPEKPEDFHNWSIEDQKQWKTANSIQNVQPSDKDGSKKKVRYHNGFIAQEVKQVMDDLGVDFAGYQDASVQGSDDGDTRNLVYEQFIGPLVKAVQEQQTIIQAHESSIQSMDSQLQSQGSQIQTLINRIQLLEDKIALEFPEP